MNSTSAPETRLDAAAALSAIEDQQNILHVRTGIRSAPLLAAWGLAWLLGYGALRLGRRPDFTVPVPHMVFFVAALVCAGLYTAVYISRRIRGIRDGSVDQGARLGAAWCGAFILWFVTIGRIGYRSVISYTFSLSSKYRFILFLFPCTAFRFRLVPAADPSALRFRTIGTAGADFF